MNFLNDDTPTPSYNGENMEHGEPFQEWLTFQHVKESSRRSQKNTEQHLKNCKTTLASVKFMILQEERDWAKIASMGDFQDKNHCSPKRIQRLDTCFPKKHPDDLQDKFFCGLTK